LGKRVAVHHVIFFSPVFSVKEYQIDADIWCCTASELSSNFKQYCNAAGAIIAGITLVVATKAGLADKLGLPIWAGICVGIGVAAMVLLGNIPMFASIPAQVYGFASVVAYTLMKDAAGSLTAASLENPVVIVILSMIVGAVFGYVSEKVAGMLAGMGSHAHHVKA